MLAIICRALVLAGQAVDAQGAAAAVLGEDLDRGLAALELGAHGIDGLEGLGGSSSGRRLDDLHPDGGVRADQRATAALDAVFRQPFRHVHGDIALLVLGGAGGPGAVVRHLGDLDLVALALDHLGGDLLDEVRGVGRNSSRQFGMTAGGLGHLDLDDVVHRRVDRAVVHLDDLVALLAVGLLDGALDGRDGLILGEDAGDQEEGGLHDHVDPGAQAQGLGQVDGVDDVEFGLLGDQLLLDLGRQLLPDLVLD